MKILSDQQALRRFGLGPEGGVQVRFARNELLAELTSVSPLLVDDTLVSSARALDRYVEQRRELRAARAKKPQQGSGTAPAIGAVKNVGSLVYDDEIKARLRVVKSAKIGFVERLVSFWSNHFAVSAYRNISVRGLVGAFEREAIRPHVLGSFAEMLLAATRHPAMLQYLNNASSVGPNSAVGKARKRGLNENHAREILELHTVGVAQYTQADVSAFARVLTGWTYDRDPDRGDIDRFVFNEKWHEPGSRQILGKVYTDQGIKQGEQVLKDLAHYPATARFLARKFAAAFVADDPPSNLVDRLEKSFIRSGGDLREFASTLLQSDEAWVVPPNKYTTPQEFLWFSIRGLNFDVSPRIATKALQALGHALWEPKSPAGYPLSGAPWMAPDAVSNRVELAYQLAGLSSVQNVEQLAKDLVGPSVNIETIHAIERADSRRQALTLLLMSSELQRR